MKKIVKGFNQFINEDFQDEELNKLSSTDDVSDESDEYIGDKAMKELANALGEDAKFSNGNIMMSGNKIEYVSEFEGFQITGREGRHKVPVKGGDIESAIDQVLAKIGVGVLTEKKKWIKTDPSEKGKYNGKNIGDLEKMKDKLLAKNATNKEAGKKVPHEDKETMSELNFALRAKRGHGFKS